VDCLVQDQEDETRWVVVEPVLGDQVVSTAAAVVVCHSPRSSPDV
jgi:hypothetical protein